MAKMADHEYDEDLVNPAFVKNKAVNKAAKMTTSSIDTSPVYTLRFTTGATSIDTSPVYTVRFTTGTGNPCTILSAERAGVID